MLWDVEEYDLALVRSKHNEPFDLWRDRTDLLPLSLSQLDWICKGDAVPLVKPLKTWAGNHTRSCAYHVIVSIFPIFSPYAVLLGQWFSSPTASVARSASA